MKILAIDPGPTMSAYCIWDGKRLFDFGKVENEEIIKAAEQFYYGDGVTACVIEKIASYGMAVGAEVFETCYWSGRFAQAIGPGITDRIPRLEVKLHLCRDSKARDANVRQAIIDRFGGKEKAIGKKATPGPLFGVSGDCWSALAVALTWFDLNSTEAKRTLFREKQRLSA
jgi:hypothetical protein